MPIGLRGHTYLSTFWQQCCNAWWVSSNQRLSRWNFSTYMQEQDMPMEENVPKIELSMS